MIWYNLKELERKISNNQFTDKEGLSYLLASLIVSTVFFNDSMDKNFNAWEQLVQIVFDVVMIVWGLKTTFSINDKLDGKDYFKRLIAISWVVGIQMLVWFAVPSLIVFLSYSYIADANGLDEAISADYKGILKTIVLLALQFVSVQLVIRSFRRLKNPA